MVWGYYKDLLLHSRLTNRIAAGVQEPSRVAMTFRLSHLSHRGLNTQNRGLSVAAHTYEDDEGMMGCPAKTLACKSDKLHCAML